MNDETFLWLEKEAQEYSCKPITKYFPLRIFNDHKDDSLKIIRYIEKRCPNHKDLFCSVDKDDMTLQGTVQDYIPKLDKFVCHFAGIRNLFDRLNMQFK